MRFTLVPVSFLVGSAVVKASNSPRGTQGNAPNSKDNNRYNQTHPNGIVGAAYFITNQPEGNFIVGSHIDHNGKLSFKDATWAGGRGAHANNDPIFGELDPLWSQGVIKVSGKHVFTVNPGSNTATMFSINQNEPAKLKMVGQPVSTGGEFPVSVAISEQSGNVCVVNGGKVNGINCFKQDPKLGLIQLDDAQRSLGLNQTTPAIVPYGSVSQVLFSENGKQVIVAVKDSPPTPGFLAVWDVDPKTGALSRDFTKVTPTGGVRPFSMSIIPGKNAVLATDAVVGFDIFDFKNGKNASSTAVPIAGQIATCWSTFSPKTGNFFLIDIGTGEVTEVNVDDQLKGAIVKQYPQGQDSGIVDNDIATIHGKDFMYVLAAGRTSILVLSLDAPGKAKPLQEFKFAEAAKQAGVSIDPNNLQGMTVFLRGN